jgi:hypothetical protein
MEWGKIEGRQQKIPRKKRFFCPFFYFSFLILVLLASTKK